MLTKFCFALLGIFVFTIAFLVWNSMREEKLLAKMEADVFGTHKE